MVQKIIKIISKTLVSLLVFPIMFLTFYCNVQAEYHSNLINQVEKYTSEYDNQKINSLFENSNYEEAKLLIQSAKDGYRERWSYKGLLSNEMYIAYQFKEYMTGDFFSKGWWANFTSSLSGFFCK